MNIKLIRNATLSQKLAITPTLRKSIELLQLSRNELLQTIKNSINENPFLSNDTDHDDFFSKELDLNLIEEESGLYDYLIQQLNEKKLILKKDPYALPSFILLMKMVFWVLRLMKLKKY